jgi:hypothetical protein
VCGRMSSGRMEWARPSGTGRGREVEFRHPNHEPSTVMLRPVTCAATPPVSAGG